MDSGAAIVCFFFFNDTATTEIYTLSYTTLFRSRSLILGTNKAPAPNGALVVFGLDGKVRQTLAGIDRPNNVDVEDGLMLQGQAAGIAVLTERLRRRLRGFRIASGGSALTDVSSAGGLPGFE